MKILQRYVLASFLSSFLLAFLVLTFVLSVGLLVKATQLVVDDMPISVVARFLAVGIPESFSFTIPLAALVSSLLVFGRLSSDGEIGAMKACGINLWSIMLPLVVFGLLMSAFGIYINNNVTPASHLMRRSLQVDVKSNGLLLLEPGTEQNILGKTIWFESKDEDGTLNNVHIREVSKNGTPRTIQAVRAIVTQNGDDMVLDLHKVRVDPFDEKFPGAATADRLTHVIAGAMKAGEYKPKAEDYNLKDLREWIGKHAYDVRKTEEQIAGGAEGERLAELQKALKDSRKALRTHNFELHRRFAMASAAICFLMLGMPLGIRARRRESTIGIAISLGIALLYYLFVVAGDQFVANVGGPVHLIVWFPAVVCLVVSAWLTARNS